MSDGSHEIPTFFNNFISFLLNRQTWPLNLFNCLQNLYSISANFYPRKKMVTFYPIQRHIFSLSSQLSSCENWNNSEYCILHLTLKNKLANISNLYLLLWYRIWGGQVFGETNLGGWRINILENQLITEHTIAIKNYGEFQKIQYSHTYRVYDYICSIYRGAVSLRRLVNNAIIICSKEEDSTVGKIESFDVICHCWHCYFNIGSNWIVSSKRFSVLKELLNDWEWLCKFRRQEVDKFSWNFENTVI